MATTYTLLASYTSGSAGDSIVTFQGGDIPNTYTDLLFKLSSRTDRAATTDQLKIKFNSNGANYSGIILFGNGSSATSETNTAATGGSTYLIGEYINGANSTTSTFANSEIYIPNFTSSNNKSLSMEIAQETNATAAQISMTAGLWSNTSAITSVSFESANGAKFVQYSTFYLYGIKNS